MHCSFPLKPLIPRWVKRQKFKVNIRDDWSGKAVSVMELGRKEAVWIGSFEVTSEGSSSSSELVLPEVGSWFPVTIVHKSMKCHKVCKKNQL